MKISFCLIITFLILLFSVNSQNLIPHFSNPKFESLVAQRVMDKYVCDTNVTILLNGNESLQSYVKGVTYQYSENLYQISLSTYIVDKMDRVWVLLHEMGHVIDMVNGDLCQNPKYWLGERMTHYIPYDDRPWEKSADNWALVLWLDVIGEILEEISQEDK